MKTTKSDFRLPKFLFLKNFKNIKLLFNKAITSSKNRWTLIAGILAVFFVTLIILYAVNTSTHRKTSESIVPQIPENTQVASQFTYIPKFRDPFLPANISTDTSKAILPMVRLKGIVWSKDNPLAVVEDFSGITYILKLGDKIGEDKLVSIASDGVRLKSKTGKRYELKTQP